LVANLSPCSLNQFLLLLAKYLSEVCRWSSKAYQASLPQSSNYLVGVGFPIGKRVLQDLDLKFATPERLSDLSILQQTLRIKFRRSRQDRPKKRACVIFFYLCWLHGTSVRQIQHLIQTDVPRSQHGLHKGERISSTLAFKRGIGESKR